MGSVGNSTTVNTRNNAVTQLDNTGNEIKINNRQTNSFMIELVGKKLEVAMQMSSLRRRHSVN